MITMEVLVPLPRIITIATPYLDLNGPLGRQCLHVIDRRDRKGLNTITLLEHPVDSQFQEEGHQAVRFLPNGNAVKVMTEVLIVEEGKGGKEGAVATVQQEGPMEEEVLERYHVRFPTRSPKDLHSLTSSTSGTSCMFWVYITEPHQTA